MSGEWEIDGGGNATQTHACRRGRQFDCMAQAVRKGVAATLGSEPPKVTFVTRLRSHQLPSQTARQLPDLSTIMWNPPLLMIRAFRAHCQLLTFEVTRHTMLS